MTSNSVLVPVEEIERFCAVDRSDVLDRSPDGESDRMASDGDRDG